MDQQEEGEGEEGSFPAAFLGMCQFGETINGHRLPKRLQHKNETFPPKEDGIGKERNSSSPELVLGKGKTEIKSPLKPLGGFSALCVSQNFFFFLSAHQA